MRTIYHPAMGGADPGREPTIEEIQRGAAEILKRMEAEAAAEPPLYSGLRCPVCEQPKKHTPPHGYRCPRGCQP